MRTVFVLCFILACVRLVEGQFGTGDTGTNQPVTASPSSIFSYSNTIASLNITIDYGTQTKNVDELWIIDFKLMPASNAIIQSGAVLSSFGSCSSMSNRYVGMQWPTLMQAPTKWPAVSNTDGRNLFQTYVDGQVLRAQFTGDIAILLNCTNADGSSIWTPYVGALGYWSASTTVYIHQVVPVNRAQSVRGYTFVTFRQTYTLQIPMSVAITSGVAGYRKTELYLASMDLTNPDNGLTNRQLLLGVQTAVYGSASELDTLQFRNLSVPGTAQPYLTFLPQSSTGTNASLYTGSTQCSWQNNTIKSWCTQSMVFVWNVSSQSFPVASLTGTYNFTFDIYRCNTSSQSTCNTDIQAPETWFLLIREADITLTKFVLFQIPITQLITNQNGVTITQSSPARYHDRLTINAQLTYLTQRFSLTISRIMVCFMETEEETYALLESQRIVAPADIVTGCFSPSVPSYQMVPIYDTVETGNQMAFDLSAFTSPTPGSIQFSINAAPLVRKGYHIHNKYVITVVYGIELNANAPEDDQLYGASMGIFDQYQSAHAVVSIMPNPRPSLPRTRQGNAGLDTPTSNGAQTGIVFGVVAGVVVCVVVIASIARNKAQSQNE